MRLKSVMMATQTMEMVALIHVLLKRCMPEMEELFLEETLEWNALMEPHQLKTSQFEKSFVEMGLNMQMKNEKTTILKMEMGVTLLVK